MAEETEEQNSYGRIQDFYDGKSIFITGAAGFLGSILLEIFLRCFPGIQSIYLLLREKKGVDPHTRKNLIFQKKIFSRLLEENPNIVDKVHVIPGELTESNLGISEIDLLKLVENVSIVFHCAATVSFLKNARFTAMQNAVGTNNIIKLCRKLKNLEVLVYTSTAFSNCNRKVIEEMIYRLPFPALRFLDTLQNGKEGEFEELVSTCKPDWPNSYCFSKCLTENLILDTAGDLPIAIVRPSIICPTWKEPIPGYIEEGTGLVDLSTAVGKGFVRVIYGNPNAKFDMIPCDIVAKAHITAAWSVATKRSPSPFVVNCCGSNAFKVTFGEYCKNLMDMVSKNTLPKSFQNPSMIIVNSKTLYWIYSIYEHFIPAVFIDAMLYLKGSKFRLVPLYKFLGVIMDRLSFFTTMMFDFNVENFTKLTDQLHSSDKELMNMDLHEVCFTKISYDLPRSSPFFEWTRDSMSPAKRKRTIYLQTMMINLIKRAILFFICWILYIIITRIFIYK